MVRLSPSDLLQAASTTDASTRWRLESEDLHVRNHDPRTDHDVRLTIRRDGDRCHHAEYHLLPAQSGSSVNLLQSGEYTVTAVVDDTERETATVRVSDDPNQTIVVEIINGSVRISEGVS
ncbi:hypothetical protein GJ633_09475 [Halorubrum sp. CBA1125]|uniref:hypothetical protein n=1 Tax=Halorubrum sp. CBA1125 TaxID=2668072 RepID=UPI0012E784E5|nr:hypothetical protein [Halorubrum sp. CBA1125]MUW14867.1 hypothetical protein [Halorubrum sp. CBA1125]